ncbi:hypothetical protein Hypma_002884 [Hypsizygus marmoreus]|uniref:Uncharacterized protein n=1 Tax=Hypsizygus marmoreus TaxID=39966 RepID=A0A369J5D1_HYPMA|nr:hypothetical protein Hypma_002884 [Hypsizygus marmoreus]
MVSPSGPPNVLLDIACLENKSLKGDCSSYIECMTDCPAALTRAMAFRAHYLRMMADAFWLSITCTIVRVMGIEGSEIEGIRDGRTRHSYRS